MALSRKFLKDLLAEYDNADDMVGEIIEAHAETVAAYKNEMEMLKEKHDGKSYEEIHAEIESAEAEIERIKAEAFDENGVSWKDRAEEMEAKRKNAEEEYRQMLAYRERESAYLSMLSDCGIAYKYRGLIANANRAAISAMEMDDGKVKDAERMMDFIRSEYKEFADAPNPVRRFTRIGGREERKKARIQTADLLER